jgi:hypothetical protein
MGSMMALPNKQELRATFHEMVQNINERRGPDSQLLTPFYQQVAAATFEICYQALLNYDSDTAQALTASAPAGSAKTTFATAFMAALTSLTSSRTACSAQNKDCPFGCVLVVDLIEKADDKFHELNALIPGQVAIYTTAHNTNRSDNDLAGYRLRDTDVTFMQDQLKRYPVCIVTHQMFGDANGDKARYVLHRGRLRPRAFIALDECPTDVLLHPLTLEQTVQVYETISAIKGDGPHERVQSLLGDLVEWMHFKAGGTKQLERPEKAIIKDMAWFQTEDATTYAHEYRRVSNLRSVFAFARALAVNRVFIDREQGGLGLTYFSGYQSNMQVMPGTVILDASADIDGVTPLHPCRIDMPMPRASYSQLQAVFVPNFTRQKLSTFFEVPENRQRYAAHMIEVIKKHMSPGQRALVVCKQKLLIEHNVPQHPEDWSHENPYHWNLDGRQVDVVNWGRGIGLNTWRDADVVFLFDEFYQRRRDTLSRAQGLLNKPVSAGPIAKMRTLSTKTEEMTTLHQGHLLRWCKQMALRGKARAIGPDGQCARQKVVFIGDQETRKRLETNWNKLFPGAQPMEYDAPKPKVSRSPFAKHQTIADQASIQEATRAAPRDLLGLRFLALFDRPDLPDSITGPWCGQQLGVEWRKVSKDLLGAAWVMTGLADKGRRYFAGRGRKPGTFRRAATGPEKSTSKKPNKIRAKSKIRPLAARVSP